MRLHSRLVRACATAVTLVSALAAHAAPLPEYDATFASPPLARRTVAARLTPDLARLARVEGFDERFGVPSFVWGTARVPVSRGAATRSRGTTAPDAAARSHLGALAPLYGLQRSDVSAAKLVAVHDAGSGASIVTYRAEVGGIPVFRDAVSVCLDRDRQLVALSGHLPPAAAAPAEGVASFSLDGARAVALALRDFAALDAEPAVGAVRREGEDGYLHFAAPAVLRQREGDAVARDLRARRVWFRLGGALEPAWYVEVMGETSAYAYVMSAADGRLLFRHGLMCDAAFGYRVWASTATPYTPSAGPQGDGASPHPTGTPDLYNPSLVAPGLVTLQNGPVSTNDPWLAPGATETLGNNVDAYVDLASPDGLGAGDFRAPTSAAGLFDWTYNHTLNPGASATQRNASITTLFYLNNWLHDWWYDAGFDEASGNAQTDNFGRGGLGGDVIHAEGQDYGGTNNANMSTPADGGSPRMQMYVFNPAGASSVIVSSPPAIAGTYASGTAAFGPQSFVLTDTVVVALDAVAPTTDGCSAITGSLAGKIALIDRGTCGFPVKVQNAQNAGAVGVIVVNNTTGVANMGGTSGTITIPSLLVSQADGNAIRAQLTGGATVVVTLSRPATVQRDGTIDGHIVAHEWMHYMSNRLVGDASGLSSQQGGGMGEGWSDFSALLMAAREDDALQGVYPTGPYALSHSGAATNVYYYGIRRYPYSYDMSKNPLTFRHVQDGNALPVGPPMQGDPTGATNSEVHRTGEVWCSMLWDCFVALASDTPRLTFDEARERMKRYVVGGLKLTPNAPTITEARDGILAAAIANDPDDFALIAQAFARRGCGTGAVSPPRTSPTNTGVVESFVVGGEIAVTAVTLDDDLYSCDSDSYLDNHERATLRVTLANTGVTTLAGTTLSLVTTSLHASFPDGNLLSVPATTPFSAVTLDVPVDLAGATANELLEIWVSADDPGLVVPGPRTIVFRDYVHSDEGTSATDDAEAHNTSWSASGYGGDSWARLELAAGSHAYQVPDAGGVAEVSFDSPPLEVSPSAPFTLTFQHRWSFEYDVTYDYDGGVIELSTDGGASWSDVGTSVSPGYTGTLANVSGNPLGGRAAWTKQSAGYPAMTSATLSLGTTYAGQTVRLRFKHAADAGVGAPGWWLDNLVVSGVTNLPFVSLGPEAGACAPLATGDDPRPEHVSLALAGDHPSRGLARLRFALPASGRVRLTVHDLAGRAVATLADGEYTAGWHTAAFARTGAGELAGPGVYFAKLVVDGRQFTQRLVMLR